MEHLHNSCQYFKGNFQLEESLLESDRKEMSELKEISHRFLLETKYLEKSQEGVASFTWRGDAFLLTFSCLPSSSFVTFNLLLLGSKEQARGWRVRLEVLGSGGKDAMQRRTAYEGPPASVNQVDTRRRRIKREVARVTVGQEMIIKTLRGRKAFFDIDLTFKRLGGVF